MAFSLFSSFRERKRLAREVKFWRDRSLSLEKKVEGLTAQLLERDFLWSDRFLTAKVGTFAIADEANERIYQKRQPEVTDGAEKAELKAFLRARKDELYQDAKDAGATEAAADRRYTQLEPEFIELFQSQQNF